MAVTARIPSTAIMAVVEWVMARRKAGKHRKPEKDKVGSDGGAVQRAKELAGAKHGGN